LRKEVKSKVTLKIDFQRRLKNFLTEKERNEIEIARTKKEIETCELLLTRSDKRLFNKGETRLTAEETEDLRYEILAMKDILVWYESKLERNVMDIHLTQAKLEMP
jgi:hypothetical protein